MHKIFLFIHIFCYMILTIIPISTTFSASAAASKISAAPQLNVRAYVLMDADTGVVLAAKNENKRIDPASTTKMMTAYILDQVLDSGKVQKDQWVEVSHKAANIEPTRIGITTKTSVTVEELQKGMIINSGNDASIALAEHIAGSEENFSKLMNQEAARLEMKNTYFLNANGLPNPNHYSSAYDLAKLARAIINDFPESYAQYSEKSFTYNGITKKNSNDLLLKDNSVDGIKTGYTRAAGYCLVSSAKRNNMRLISVVMGAKTVEQRAKYSSELLNYGFRHYETHQVYAANQPITELSAIEGKEASFAVGLTDDLYITIPRDEYDNVTVTLNIKDPIQAPVKQHQVLGDVVLTLNDETLAQQPIVALNTLEKANWWDKFKQKIS